MCGTGVPSSHCEKFFFNLYVNVQLVKHDIVTAVIHCYMATKFHYAKCDSRLSAYGGVMLQQFEFTKG